MQTRGLRRPHKYADEKIPVWENIQIRKQFLKKENKTSIKIETKDYLYTKIHQINSYIVPSL